MTQLGQDNNQKDLTTKDGEQSGEQATVSLHQIRLSQTTWCFIDLNLVILKSNMSKATIHLEKSEDDIQTEVTLNNSTVGTLDAGAGFNITVQDCYVRGSDRFQHTFLHIQSSSVSFSDCHFNHNIVPDGKTGLVHAELQSSVKIVNCIFEHNSGNGSVVLAENTTEVEIINSVFSNNVVTQDENSVLKVYSGSTLRVLDSEFSDNFSPSGGVMRTEGAVVTIIRCRFRENAALFGGVYVLKNSTLHSQQSLYEGNIADNDVARERFGLPEKCLITCEVSCEIIGPCLDSMASAGVGLTKQNSRVTMDTDSYLDNDGHFVGLLLANSGSVEMTDTDFKNNSAVTFLLTIEGNTRITNCNFLRNRGQLGTLTIGGHNKIHNATFIENTGDVASGISNSGTLSLTESYFEGNRHFSLCYPGVCGATVTSEIFSSVSISDTHFNSNEVCLVGKAGTYVIRRVNFTDNSQNPTVNILQGTLNLSESRFHQGQVAAQVSKVHIENCSFSQVRSTMIFSGSTVLLRHVSVGDMLTTVGFAVIKSNFTVEDFRKDDATSGQTFYVDHSDVIMRRATVTDNSQRFLFASRSSVRVEDSRFVDSTSQNLFHIHNSSRIHVEDSQFINNNLVMGVYKGSKAFFKRCVLANNSEPDDVESGSPLNALLVSHESDATIVDTSLLSNPADLIISVFSNTTLRNVHVVGDGSTMLFVSNSKIHVHDSSFYGEFNFNALADRSAGSQVLFWDSSAEFSNTTLEFKVHRPHTLTPCYTLISFNGGETFFDRSTITSLNFTDTRTYMFCFMEIIKTRFKMASTRFTNLTLHYDTSPDAPELLSWNTTFLVKHSTASSLQNPQFPREAISSGFLVETQGAERRINTSDIHETQYASGKTRHQCSDGLVTSDSFLGTLMQTSGGGDCENIRGSEL